MELAMASHGGPLMYVFWMHLASRGRWNMVENECKFIPKNFDYPIHNIVKNTLRNPNITMIKKVAVN